MNATRDGIADPDMRLLVPDRDVEAPELTILIPAADEELTIREFLAWCHEGLHKANIVGEILIVDSSRDRTAEIAIENGARVLKTPKRGLGRAYMDARPYIRGKYVLMGDCDCTYDFRELRAFVEKFRRGGEFIMGSRFRGYIEPGSMPALHRYFGTPVTTFILNVVFGSRFSDIHCGMRGITRDALQRMELRSNSWEYASEMIIKSVHMRLRTEEVPIRFLKDREGRVSHHKRLGWFSPWYAAWINLRAMFIYGADFFLFKPGLVILALGIALTLPLSFGVVTVGPITFSLHWMQLGVSLFVVGLQAVYMGILAQLFFDYSGEVSARWLKRFPYTRTVTISTLLFAVGGALAALLTITYVRNDFRLLENDPVNHLGVTGLVLMMAAFMTFTFTLLLHSTVVAVRPR